MLKISKKLNYRILPVLILAIFRGANAVEIGLVIPLYFFRQGYSTDLIGLLTSSITFTYIFSPLLFKKIAQNKKKKNILLTTTILMFSLQSTFQFTLNPWIFLLIRLLEGILTGLFWPILGATISSLNSYNIVKENGKWEYKIIQRYTFSVQFGVIFGFLIGAFVLFIISDLQLIFDITLIFMMIMVIMAILYEEPLNHEQIENNNLQKPKKNASNWKNIIFAYLIAILYAFIRSSFKFLYPIKFEILDFEHYINYLSSFFLSGSQLVFSYIGMRISNKNLNKTLLIAFIIEFVVFFFTGLSKNLLSLNILIGFMGCTLGILYCYSFKKVISINVEENTSKYSFYYESMVGIGFFSGPLISGIIANNGINNTLFIFSGLILFSILIISIYKIGTNN